jgi:hypothetical protein
MDPYYYMAQPIAPVSNQALCLCGSIEGYKGLLGGTRPNYSICPLHVLWVCHRPAADLHVAQPDVN